MNDADPMVRKRMKDEKDVIYTLYNEYNFVYIVMGYGRLTRLQFLFCAGLLLSSHIFVMSMAIYAMYMVWPSVSLAFAALHSVTISTFAQWGLAILVFGSRDLLKIIEKLKYGIYIYGEGDIEDERVSIRTRVSKELKLKFDQVKYIYLAGFIMNSFLFPVSQYFLFDEERDNYPIFINPYLVHVFYNPFNSRTATSHIVTYIVHFLYVMFVYTICLRILGVYASCAVNLKVHFDILNESIGNIRERAYKMYLKDHSYQHDNFLKQDVFKMAHFQKYLMSCLKSNIKHHQTLLRFREDSQFIIGNVVLQVFVLAALVYATILYQMYQFKTLPINVLINYVTTSLAEQAYTFFLCTLGEGVITSSSHVFFTLYSVKWYHFDELFKQTLLVTMINSRVPVEYRALIMNVPASIVTYGNSLSIMYKITNVAQQSDILN